MVLTILAVDFDLVVDFGLGAGCGASESDSLSLVLVMLFYCYNSNTAQLNLSIVYLNKMISPFFGGIMIRGRTASVWELSGKR